jgi:hypothetical protein
MVCLREPHARDLMQKILDRSQEPLEYAFASLAKTAKRQQRVYLATIGIIDADGGCFCALEKRSAAATRHCR